MPKRRHFARRGSVSRSTLPSSEGRDSVEVNCVQRVHEIVAIEEAGRIGSEQFGDEPVFGRVERGRVGTDENIRLGPQWTAFGQWFGREHVKGREPDATVA